MAELSIVERMLLFYGTRMPNHPRKWWLHAHLRKIFRAAPVGDFEVERGGLHWFLDPDDFEHENLFWLGGMDRWDIHHIGLLLGPGSVFFDIGTNFGYYSLNVINHLAGMCRVHAFEPNPSTRDRLCRNITANKMEGAITVHPLAISDSAGNGNLIERPDNSGAARLGDDAAGVPVKVTTLDLFCDQHAVDRLDVVKIDVEGHEVRVLKGASGALSRFKPALVIEFWTPGLSRAAATVDDLAEMLEGMGFTLFLPVRERLEPVAELPRSENPVNIFAFHRERPLTSFLTE